MEVDVLGTGRTRDVSTGGVFFETDESLVPGTVIKYSLVLDQSQPDAPTRVCCEGDVVRVERRDERLGVAVTMTNFRFDPDSELDPST